MNVNELEDLKKEFEAMTGGCTLSPDQQEAREEENEEEIPHYVEELQKKLLTPSISGVYLTRIDLKRIADDLEESLPIKERKPMLRALMRHTTSKATLTDIFTVMNRYIDGRLLIYRELAEAFPASSWVFTDNEAKIEKTKKMFERIVEDFEEIELTDEALLI